MGLLKNLSPWDEDTYGNNIKTLRVLVECEKGSVHKYEYDDASDSIVIVRDLAKDYAYIYNYGAIPQTLADDGDPLDAIILSDEPIRPKTVVNCIPLAVVYVIDNGEIDNKIICAPFYAQQTDFNLKKIVHYLCNYKYPNQAGTKFLGVGTAPDALDEIARAHELYLK